MKKYIKVVCVGVTISRELIQETLQDVGTGLTLVTNVSKETPQQKAPMSNPEKCLTTYIANERRDGSVVIVGDGDFSVNEIDKARSRGMFFGIYHKDDKILSLVNPTGIGTHHSKSESNAQIPEPAIAC